MSISTCVLINNFFRSYGSISPTPEESQFLTSNPSPPSSSYGHSSGNSLHVPLQSRRRQRAHTSGGPPKYEQLYSFPAPGSNSELEFLANPTPSAPPSRKMNIPIINIEQDDNFLTVDTSFKWVTTLCANFDVFNLSNFLQDWRIWSVIFWI